MGGVAKGAPPFNGGGSTTGVSPAGVRISV